ncbi:zinc finger protein chinmo isoform X2 [Plodia interpunctella]|nr:zinc finger protein chinmo isoform X2 [Plodia interpunctella]XP_053599835.1 zinc finger protein chinmo isoform X2 [Plodia interpunctella]XP_053599842.1 zinc finger protein chinmo isoform X2 [Plodia interpunctella]
MDSQQQQYCLKWNSFGSNLATSFANLWNSESLADVTLYCEGRQFKAHKVILAACSKHFQELFDTAPPSHAGACYVILEATTADNMQALLEFMYKGEVHVSQDALSSFLKSGENLQVKGLSMEMSPDAWVKQQTTPSSGDRQTRIKTSPVSGSGNCEVQESAPPQSHTATFAPIMSQYGMPIHTSGGNIGRYAPPAHLPINSSHRRPAPPKPSPSQSPHARNYRQSSSSSHCGSVADEPDTRSSPGAGPRYEDNPPDCTSTLGNPVKNNGYERSASANDEMVERLSSEQGAEDLRIKIENDYQAHSYSNSPPPPAPTSNYHDKPVTTSPHPPKPSPDLWPAKIITSKSGGIATPDGKKLKCPYCERLYGYETNLRAHIRQRHQGIRVPCPHCSRTFTRNNTVRRHIAREHRHHLAPHQGPLSNHTQ